MNPEEVRGVFRDALDQPTPAARTTTDDIVDFGRRKVRHRRFATSGASVAAVAAVAIGAVIAMPFGEQVPDSVPGNEDTAGPVGCAPPSGVEPGEADPVGKLYQDALSAEMAAYGADVTSYDVGDKRHGFPPTGFAYNTELCGYYYQGTAAFLDLGQQYALDLVATIHDPDGTDPAARIPELAGCESIEGECEWTAADAVMLVHEEREIQFDEDEGSPEMVEFLSALVAHPDGTIVQLQVSPSFGEGMTITLAGSDLAAVAISMPIGGEGPELPPIPGDHEQPGDQELIDSFVDVVAEQIPGADLSGQELAFAQGDEGLGDGVRLATGAVVLDGEEAEVVLWVQPIDDPGDSEPGSDLPALHYANCEVTPNAECTVDHLDEYTARTHRTIVGESTELASFELRSDEAWHYGVLVRYVDAEGTPPVDFDQLDAIVAAVG
jgi:hypothetical protein